MKNTDILMDVKADGYKQPLAPTLFPIPRYHGSHITLLSSRKIVPSPPAGFFGVLFISPHYSYLGSM